MNENETNIGEFLRAKRLKKDMTIRQLALYAGCSASYLSMLERGIVGSRGPTPSFLRKLVHPLGVPYEVLLEAAGYRVLTEDERLYSGAWVQMIRDSFGDTVKDFAQRLGAFPYEVHALEQQGVSFETLHSICQKANENQRKLTSDQKAIVQRMELALCELPQELSEKLEYSLGSILSLVEHE